MSSPLARDESPPATSSGRASTRIDDEDHAGSANHDVDEKLAPGYLEKGVYEVDEKGQKKQVMLVREEKTGKEIIKEIGGPYTQPRWRHSLPFINPKYPPQPPPLSLDDALPTPEKNASWFSLLFFNWISPMMALGSVRPLQPTDLWKMDESRSSALLSKRLVDNFQKRQRVAEEWNTRLADTSTPLPLRQRLLYPLLPHREKREHDFRTKHGKKTASLTWALSDTFGRYFWLAGCIKIVGDTAGVTSPLVLRQLIAWSNEWQIAQQTNGLTPYPSMGRGAGLAIGLFLMLVVSSISLHHFFVRSMGTGVLSRSALISAIYDRSLRLTTKARGQLPNGKIVNHISTDTSRIDFAAGFFHIIWTGPVQFIVAMIILLVLIGYSALPGIGFLLIMSPVQIWIMKNLFVVRKKSMIWTDKRAKLLQEILGGMRIVKLMAWELPFLRRLGAIREMELKYVRTLLIFRSGMMAFAMSLPTLAAILSFITYKSTQHNLEAATIFTVITLFQIMRLPLMMWPMALSTTADAKNALNRLQAVFEAEVVTEERVIDPSISEGIRIEHASFSWDAAPIAEDDPALKLKGKHANAINGTNNAPVQPKKKKVKTSKKVVKEGAVVEEKEERIFKIHDVDLVIPKGALVAVVGSIGSGKSSLLQGLMGEMRKTEGKVVFSGSTSLCAQTPWIQNATVRENILFGQPWDEERYWAAVRDACLETDLELLDDGDGTEIGEKGINLSGGQKQRVNIARAIYFNADIIALDDPLSALDAGVGKALFFNAILGALSGKTRILVTHALHFLPYADFIVTMEDGRVSEQGTYNELRKNNGAFARLVREFGSDDREQEEAENEELAMMSPALEMKHDRSAMTSKGTAQTLMQAEERNSGAMRKGTYWNYFKAGKGQFMIPVLIFAVVLAQAFTVITSFWLVWWQETRWNRGDPFYMGVYAALGIGSALGLFFMGFSQALITYFASVRLHRSAIERVMFAPQAFFDTTPLGRIMNRFAKDIDTIDNTLGDAMRMAVSTLANIIGATILLAIIQPYFLIAMAVVICLYAHNAMFYRRSSREFKRIDAILRSSLYSHFSESLSGIGTIRSYGESRRFVQDNVDRMDIENRAYYLTIVNQRWLGIRLDFLGSLLTLSVAIIVVTSHSISAASAGLGLSTMVTVQQSFSWLVRQMAEVENDMVGAERIMYYANQLEQEAPHVIQETKPDAAWPAEGRVDFDNVFMRYREELPDVLKGLTLNVGASEKIGVVGRTGAGKSSIMVSLFRMAELSSGSIKIDGVDISKIGLNDLRSGISIIPQDPLLFSGTLRSNIDPFHTKNDLELYDALKRSHLLSSNASATEASRFTLDTVVEEEGGNLSVGERSLVSLARALVRNTKVLVLDEATASVDVETDAKIQETIRTEFRERTLLVIAHRLRTILSYDRIVVMDDGRVAEFDTPEALFLQSGIFAEMCGKSSITLQDIRAAAALRF
ncbi:hypothetical protein P7C73_g3094, partial [Tremellales sp. Uapishka_1]